MKEKVKKIIPKYAIVPLLSLIIMNTLTYTGSKIITNNMHHFSLFTEIDKSIPFIPVFVIFYILAYIQWIVGYIVIARYSKEVCYKYLATELMAKTVCLICFFVIPTTMIRPEITSTNNIFIYLVNFIYLVDEPVNLFPSIHTLESWFCFRASMSLKFPMWYKISHFILAILVMASTILIKQHVIFDVIGAILIVEICLIIGKKINIGIIFDRRGVMINEKKG